MPASPIELLSTIDVYGFYVPPFFLWIAAALVPFALVRWTMRRAGLYRFVWHRALFDIAMYVIVLGGTILVGGAGWL
jgi:hypothetical protein